MRDWELAIFFRFCSYVVAKRSLVQTLFLLQTPSKSATLQQSCSRMKCLCLLQFKKSIDEPSCAAEQQPNFGVPRNITPTMDVPHEFTPPPSRGIFSTIRGMFSSASQDVDLERGPVLQPDLPDLQIPNSTYQRQCLEDGSVSSTSCDFFISKVELSLVRNTARDKSYFASYLVNLLWNLSNNFCLRLYIDRSLHECQNLHWTISRIRSV